MNACREWIDTGKKWYKWVHIKNNIKVQYLYHTSKGFDKVFLQVVFNYTNADFKILVLVIPDHILSLTFDWNLVLRYIIPQHSFCQLISSPWALKNIEYQY